jgi:hypothetical protein
MPSPFHCAKIAPQLRAVIGGTHLRSEARGNGDACAGVHAACEGVAAWSSGRL